MNSIFEKNMEALKREIPNFQLKDDDEDIKFISEDAKSGVKTIKCLKDGKTLYIHSKYDPEKEADTLIDRYKERLQVCRVVTVFGMGMGYHIRNLLQNKQAQTIIIIVEPSWNSFKEIINNTDITDIISNSDIMLLIGNNTGYYSYLFEQALNNLNFDDAFIIMQAGYKNIYDEAAKEVTICLRNKLKDLKLYKNTIYYENLNWTVLNILNIRHMFDSKAMNAFINKFKGRPAIIVSAGPSLNKNIHLLKDAKGKFLIICVYTAYSSLRKNGIEPDFVTFLDAHQDIGESDDQKKEHYNVPLVYLPTGKYDLVTRFTAEKFYCKTSHSRIIEPIITKKKLENVAQIHTAGTISISAMDLAVQSGANPVVLIGQDLAFTGKKPHADGTVYAENEKLVKELEENIDMRRKLKHGSVSEELSKSEYDKIFSIHYVKDIDGNDVETDVQMSVYIKNFESYIKAHSNVCIIDATEGGALIKGTKLMTLKEVINEYGQYDDIDDIVAGVLNEENILKQSDLNNIIKQIKMHIDITKSLEKYAKQGREETNKLELMYAYGKENIKMLKSATKKFTKLDEKMNRIIGLTALYEPVYEVIKYELQRHLPEHEKNEQFYFINHSRIIYDKIIYMCGTLLPALNTLKDCLTQKQEDGGTI